LRIVSTARAIGIEIVAAFCTASSVASAAALSASWCCHGRDSITKGVSSRSIHVNVTAGVHATKRFGTGERLAVVIWAAWPSRVGCDWRLLLNATKAHECREQEKP